jgi:hypothetical protein
MKTRFTDNEISILILIVILSLLRGAYNLYILYTTRRKNVNVIQEMTEKNEDLSFFNIVQFTLSVLYVFISVYFVLNGKVNNLLFALVCLFMFARGMGYFMIRYMNDIPFMPDTDEPRFIYYNFMYASLLMFLTSAYFVKVIFFNK